MDAAAEVGQPAQHPSRIAYEINEFPGEDTIYIGDGGDVVTISAQAVRPRNPGALVSLGQKGAHKGRREHITCSQLYPDGLVVHAPDAMTQTMDT